MTELFDLNRNQELSTDDDSPSDFVDAPRGRISNAQDALKFILAGNASFTLVSAKTGTRYTYKVKKSDKGNIHFVYLLTGPDNESSFTYIGVIRAGTKFELTKASSMKASALPIKGIEWAVRHLARGEFPCNAELWHEGKCGRCGRKLTVPESIAAGLGPECAGRV